MQTLKLTKKYEKYPEYKDSGVKWLGNIPKDWRVGKVKEVFNLLKERSFNNSETEILSLTLNGIKTRDVSNNEGQIAASYEGYRKIIKGDIVLNPMDLIRGFVDSSKYEGIISPAYSTLRKRDSKVNSQFYNYFFQKYYFEKIFHPYGNGVSVDHRWTLKDDTLMNFPIIIIPEKQQTKIAKYLDEKTETIDKIIEEKQKLVEFLQEKRTAVINQSVTRGLDSKVELVDSGVNWIGKIPRGWKIKRLKDVRSYCSRGGTPEYTEDESKNKFINQSCVRDGFLDFDKIKYSLSISKKGLVKNGDILINSTGTGTLGRMSVFNDDEEYFADTHVTIFRPNKIDSSFVMYLLQNPAWQNYLYASSVTGSTNQIELSRNKFLEIPIILPNTDEQKKIVIFLNKKVEYFDMALKQTKQSIEILQEFKSSLVSNVVTGKIKI